MAKVGFPHGAEYIHQNTLPEPVSCLWSSTVLFSCRRRHVTSHRSSSFTLLQSLAIEDSRDKPTYSVLLGQLFAFIGTNPDQAVGRVLPTTEEWLLTAQGGAGGLWQSPRVRWTSFLCLSGVQQQLSFGCADEVAARKYSQAGTGAHAGIADGCSARRGRDTPCGSSDYGPSGRTQVSCF